MAPPTTCLTYSRFADCSDYYDFSFCNDSQLHQGFLINSKSWTSTFGLAQDVAWQGCSIKSIPASTAASPSSKILINTSKLIRIFPLCLTNELLNFKPSRSVHAWTIRAITSMSRFTLIHQHLSQMWWGFLRVDNAFDNPSWSLYFLDIANMVRSDTDRSCSAFDQQGITPPLLYKRFMRKSLTETMIPSLVAQSKPFNLASSPPFFISMIVYPNDALIVCSNRFQFSKSKQKSNCPLKVLSRASRYY